MIIARYNMGVNDNGNDNEPDNSTPYPFLNLITIQQKIRLRSEMSKKYAMGVDFGAESGRSVLVDVVTKEN